MDITEKLEEYIDWFKAETSVRKLGEYYEISVPFLDKDKNGPEQICTLDLGL